MLANAINGLTFIKRIITGGVTWAYEYDVKNDQQSSEWGAKNELKR